MITAEEARNIKPTLPEVFEVCVTDAALRGERSTRVAASSEGGYDIALRELGYEVEVEPIEDGKSSFDISW